MPPTNTLDRISRGERVRVTAVLGDDAIARRLDDLGLRDGVEVEVLRRAPLGDPTVFELHGYQLCLRRSESQRVEVEAARHAERQDATPRERDGRRGDAKTRQRRRGGGGGDAVPRAAGPAS